MEKAKTNWQSETPSSCIRDSRSSQLKSTQNQFGLSRQLQFVNFSNTSSTPLSLLSLCIGIVGGNLEEIIDHLSDLAPAFSPNIKLVLFAIARRRKLLDDGILIALADSSWEIVDLSGSNVSDHGLSHLLDVCQNLKAVDISCCSRLTSTGVSKLLQISHSLVTLRWGGCPRSEDTARKCLCFLKPNLNDIGSESWEELDADELAQGAQSLRWLVWPNIDKISQEIIAIESPRIVVNPKASISGFRGSEVPIEALQQFELDNPVVQNIDPKIWVVNASSRTTLVRIEAQNEMSVAEKFRLAFLDRDARLAPKRAKNVRQHQRRAEREWIMWDSNAKASALASKAVKSLNPRG